jgi:hypothetical protein
MPQPNEDMLNAIYGLSESSKFITQFPEDIENVPHIAIFRAYKFQRLSRQDKSRTDCIAEITLPMPSNLSTEYKADYQAKEFGAFGAVAENLVSKVNANSANPAGMISKISGETAINAGAGVAASMAIGTIGETGTLAIGAFGVARNPHKIVMYQGSDFRSHSFEYQFTPRSQEESFRITNIIKAFKYYMSASYGIGNLAAGLGALSTQLGKIGFGEGANLSALGQLTGKAAEPTGDLLKSLAGTSGGLVAKGVDLLGGIITGIGKTATATPAEVTSFAQQAAQESRAFFEYPEVFRITLMPGGQTDNPHIFQIAECVLEDFKVEYDPQGGARFVRGKDNVPAPASVKISMTFKETSLVTKENIRDRYFGDGGKPPYKLGAGL